jgi:hypothetical protein
MEFGPTYTGYWAKFQEKIPQFSHREVDLLEFGPTYTGYWAL